MSFTYSGDPSSSSLDEVRFHVQDTDPLDQLVSNEEIQYLITLWTPVYNSNIFIAAAVAENIAAKFAREVNVGSDGVNVGIEALAQRYNDLASSLRDSYKALAGASGVPTASGTIFDDYYDSSIKPLSFSKGMNDNRRAGQQEYGGSGFYQLNFDFEGLYG